MLNRFTVYKQDALGAGVSFGGVSRSGVDYVTGMPDDSSGASGAANRRTTAPYKAGCRDKAPPCHLDFGQV
jgi:hypothetical protein